MLRVGQREGHEIDARLGQHLARLAEAARLVFEKDGYLVNLHWLLFQVDHIRSVVSHCRERTPAVPGHLIGSASRNCARSCSLQSQVFPAAYRLYSSR